MSTVQLYKFNKVKNSTQRPTNTSLFATISGTFLAQTSLTQPSIIFDLNYDNIPDRDYYESMRECNYAYITDLGNRYYYIYDWIYSGKGLWVAQMRVDVLATYRDVIGQSSQYVLRSASSKDGYIIDNNYSITTIDKRQNNITFWSASGDDLDYIIAATTGHASAPYSGLNRIGGLIYYDLGASSMRSLLNIMASGNQTWGNIKYFDNIVNAFALPFEPVRLSSNNNIWLGADQIDNIQNWLPNIYTFSQRIRQLNLPTHPQTNTFGRFVNKSVCTKYILRFDPFGEIEINPDLYVSDAPGATTRQAWGQVKCNAGTGDTTLKITDSPNLDSGHVSNMVFGNLSIPISLSQMTKDISKITNNMLSILTGTAGAAINGNYNNALNAVNSMVTPINNIIMETHHPTMQTVKGSGGNSLAYALNGTATLYTEFLILSENDNEHIGAPLQQRKQINTLTGFIQCRNPKIQSNKMLANEIEQTESYLAGGFYYQ